MRAVVQRVLSASVTVDGAVVGSIGKGLIVYLGVMKNDDDSSSAWMDRKISSLRVFEDRDGRMNLSVLDLEYDILLVSQFTICGNVKRGNRPSFEPAAESLEAKRIYLDLKSRLEKRGIKVEQGRFQTHMEVSSINDGPVTMLIDSEKVF